MPATAQRQHNLQSEFIHTMLTDCIPIQPARMKLLLCWGLGFLMLPFLTGFGPPQLVDRIYVPTQRVGVGELQQRSQLLPPISAEAYLLYDVDANQVLLEQNSTVALAPASLTKLMTALLVLEQADLSATVVIQGSDLVGGATMGLQIGETLTVEQLLWGLLIPSGNDAATALARHVGGTVEGFVTAMNERAQQLGLTATHFINPHGLDAAGHTSSAADLLQITQQVWRYPLFRQIVAVAETRIAGHTLRNTNELLAVDTRVNGVKTGTTDLAGECLVAGIQQDGHQIFAIVLKSRDRYADIQTLYARYTASYTWFDSQHDELTVLNRLYTADATTWYLRPEGTPLAWLIRTADRARLRSFRRLHLPSTAQAWQSGMPVGVLEWWLDDEVIGMQPLVLW
ncbi:MAG: D-alanyl-D-alanine carboxypeptidase [Caldilineaceae bacterium]|nr:D-alanyl-D-alanine carboxypeptidase [Caldilineaceae bacterium]